MRWWTDESANGSHHDADADADADARSSSVLGSFGLTG